MHVSNENYYFSSCAESASFQVKSISTRERLRVDIIKKSSMNFYVVMYENQ